MDAVSADQHFHRLEGSHKLLRRNRIHKAVLDSFTVLSEQVLEGG